MTDLDRRQLLGGAAAVGAAAALSSFPTSTAGAAVPPSGTQAPGFYRYKVGSFECTSINDGARSFPMPDTFVRNVAEGGGAGRGRSRLYAKGHGDGAVQSAAHQHRQQAGADRLRQRVANLEPSKGAVGRTLQNLAAAGVDPKSVDIVLMSHLHPDHTNGIRAPTVRWRSRMPRSWCRRRTGNSG